MRLGHFLVISNIHVRIGKFSVCMWAKQFTKHAPITRVVIVGLTSGTCPRSRSSSQCGTRVIESRTDRIWTERNLACPINKPGQRVACGEYNTIQYFRCNIYGANLERVSFVMKVDNVNAHLPGGLCSKKVHDMFDDERTLCNASQQ